MNNPERVSYNLSETAAAIGVSRKFLYEKILTQPDFPVIKLGKKYIVPVDSLRKWLTAKADTDANRLEEKPDGIPGMCGKCAG